MNRSFTKPSSAIALGLCVVLGSAWLSAQPPEHDFKGLEQEMSSTERAAAGLNDLSPEQLNFLNAWLRTRFTGSSSSHVANTAAAPTGTAGAALTATDISEIEDAGAREAAIAAEVERRITLEVEAARRERAADEAAEENNEPFEATVTGNFSGWSGKTVFTLDNGQVWRQRQGSPYRHTRGDSRVRFEQNFLGLWEMTVLSSGRTVGVRRLD